jgi:hypothetical protein
MMKLIQTRPAGGDCIAPYDVELDHQYTFGELVDEILTKKEWGFIDFLGIRIEYHRDKCSQYRESLRDEPIYVVKASGGWSRMDYYVR